MIFPGDAGDTFDPPPLDRSEGGGRPQPGKSLDTRRTAWGSGNSQLVLQQAWDDQVSFLAFLKQYTFLFSNPYLSTSEQKDYSHTYTYMYILYNIVYILYILWIDIHIVFDYIIITCDDTFFSCQKCNFIPCQSNCCRHRSWASRDIWRIQARCLQMFPRDMSWKCLEILDFWEPWRDW